MHCSNSFVLLLLITLTPGHFPLEYNKLPERCKYLQDETETFHLKCKGSFPLVAYTKFRDIYINFGEPIAIYMSTNMENSFAVMKKSDLHDCNKIRLKNSNEYFCDANGEDGIVKLTNATIFCFPFHIQVIDDLLNDCLDQRGEQNDKLLEEVLKSKRGTIQYTFDYDAALKPAPAASLMAALLLLLLLLQPRAA